MKPGTSIEWTDETWNPWHGCEKVSQGCKFCYMYRDKERHGLDPSIVVKSKTKFNEPLKWKEPRLVFTCSWSDFFIEAADEWREDAWEIIRSTPHLTYQILTKRPERMEKCLPADWGRGYKNVWLGVSAEDWETFRFRSQILCETPAHSRFISAEPLIGPINMHPLFESYFKGIDWVIIGGESGNHVGKYKYRPMEAHWAGWIVQSCKDHDVAVFVKQLGTHIGKTWPQSHRTGKDPHMRDILNFPKNLQIRQFPKHFDYESRMDRV